ncbi:MAG TPA: helix-turn-helix domain-containing protein [Bacteroidota bacterium]|jgi:cytoskeletal protein RodZ
MKASRLVSIGVRLREERLRRGYSIEEIASGINVNPAFLEQLEQGIPPAVPEPYVRGILQSYARKVGLDLDQIPEQPPPEMPEPEPPAVQSKIPPGWKLPAAGRTFATEAGAPETPRSYRRALIAGFGMLTIGILGIFIFWMSRDKNTGPVQELSFNDAVKEQEEKYAAQVRKTDSVAHSQDTAAQVARGDSLLLEGRASDSVLVTIAIDHAMPRQFLLPPMRAMQWRAEKSFLLTLSNPAAAGFTLNGIRLSSLSRPDKPVKNVFLSRATIEKFQPKHN